MNLHFREWQNSAHSLAIDPNYKWKVVGMLWFTGFFNYADRQAIFSLFPLLERELHLSVIQLGLLGSSFALVYGICGPFAGSIVDRVRRKAAILGGLFTWSFICMATAVVRTYPQLLFFRAAEGLGETFYFPASMSLISDYHGKRTRSRAMGLHQTAVYIGTIAGGFFGGLIGQRYGWRWSFIVFGGLGVLLGFVLNRFLKEPARGAADREDLGQTAKIAPVRMPFFEFLRVLTATPTALLLMAAFCLANFVAMVLLSWMPKFLYDRFHMGLAVAGLTATVFVQLASMLGSPLGGWMADSLRRRFAGGRIAIQLVGLVGAAPFVIWCGQTLSVTSLMIALTAWGLFKGMYDANIFAAALDVIRPDARGAAVGFMNMTGWIGAAAAPLFIGAVAQRSGLGLAISLTAAALLLAAALLVIAMRWTLQGDLEKMSAALASPGAGA
ncbi:MAG: MFS transporter [Bryobacteraceae bacterium]|nr:MFS transporter [Bryobacteraceae bacterium]